MSDAAAGLADRLRPLRERFVARAREDRPRLEEAWQAGDRAGLARLCHSLAGNAGMFGFDEISALAKKVENAAGEERKGAQDERDLRVLLRALDAL